VVEVDHGEARDVQVTRESLFATVFLDQPGTARIAINDFPSWQAEIDGQQVPANRSDGGFIELNVPAGEHLITLSYGQPTALWLGRAMVLSGLALMIAFTLAAAHARMRSRRHVST
jgi:uncharacterized membrane protein YfhO